jgi:hypothetical protein
VAFDGVRASRFDHVAPDVGRGVRVVAVRWFPPGYAAITLRRTILVRHDRADDDALLAHELVHVEQYREMGPVRFLTRYVTGYVRAWRTARSHHQAYLAIPFEQEARARAAAWRAAHAPRPGADPTA